MRGLSVGPETVFRHERYLKEALKRRNSVPSQVRTGFW